MTPNDPTHVSLTPAPSPETTVSDPHTLAGRALALLKEIEEVAVAYEAEPDPVGPGGDYDPFGSNPSEERYYGLCDEYRRLMGENGRAILELAAQPVRQTPDLEPLRKAMEAYPTEENPNPNISFSAFRKADDDLQEAIKNLLASPPSQGDGWNYDMEAAPRDRPIFVSHLDEDRPLICRACWWKGEGGIGWGTLMRGWRIEKPYAWRLIPEEIQPAPLPTPPSVDEEAGGG